MITARPANQVTGTGSGTSLSGGRTARKGSSQSLIQSISVPVKRLSVTPSSTLPSRSQLSTCMGLPEITLTVIWGYSDFSAATARGTQRVETVSNAARRSVACWAHLQALISPFRAS